MDAWITKNPILKYRLFSLDEKDRECWREAKCREQKSPSDDTALIPNAMLEALANGHFSGDKQDELKEKLKKSAIDRINLVRKIWANLTINGQDTFASCWAKGTVISLIPEDCFSDCNHYLWKGITLGESNSDIHSLMDISPAISEKLHELCDDVITYIKWTLDWPKFVQLVRSIPQGTFKGDLKWCHQVDNQI